jgi:hydroxysqualene synthase
MKNFSIQEAFRFCEEMAKTHYENFPVGSLLIPKEKRPYIWSIYAFARTADDFADENYPPRRDFSGLTAWRGALIRMEEDRLKRLREWEEQLKSCYEKTPSHPIFLALAKTIEDLKIPYELLANLLKAFMMDVTTRRYADWDQVIHYCRHSADPVGRLVLWVFGYQEEELFELSDAICTGLQLANFWQDIAVDREKDRMYIPLSVFDRLNVLDEQLFDPPPDFPWKSLFRELYDFTFPFFQKGATLPRRVEGRLSWELRCTWLGGMKILQAACRGRREGWETRPTLGSWDKFSILWKSFFAYNREVKLLGETV